MSQPMNPTSNVDFSHDAYMNEYKDNKFQGYQGHLQYLDYFVKTDVSRRDGQSPLEQKPQQQAQKPSQPTGEGGEEGGKSQAAPEYHQVMVQNKPLVIAGDEGCGKTALISYWLNHSPLFQQKQNKNQVLLVHVAGASSCERKYQSFIHRALVKLRRTFPDVQTRLVHIIDDKLRINFSRCLDLVSNAIGSSSASSAVSVGGGASYGCGEGGESERDQSGSHKEGRIIMILDGLENFRDSENDQGIDSEQSADWVPWSFPDRFRVIILTRKRSKAMNHFKLRKCPLLYMGDQIYFNAKEINSIIDESVQIWKPQLTTGTQDSFEGRLQIIINELVIKREQIFKEQQKSQRQQRENLSEEQLLVFKSLEDELSEGNYHLLARPADELEKKFAKPTERQLNPLVIRCILNFYLYCGSSPYTGPQGIRPLDMKIILSCKTLSKLFVTVIKHFRDCMFSGKNQHTSPLSHTKTIDSIISNPKQHSSTNITSSAEIGKDKFDQLLAYILVCRKGITWGELKELIPTLSDDDIKLFQEIFGFLLIQYTPPNNIGESGVLLQQQFIFFKHASFKKAIKETIDLVINDQMRAQLHKNLAGIIEKQEPTNQFMWQRRVDELCFHYQMSGMWIKLKDLISSVEVFSTMFVVPELRYELAQQWLWLLGQQNAANAGGKTSSKQQCDPVVEYNKALESFIIKYRPTSKELFVIMIQLCRFFKEDLAELVSGAEASEPLFAHPPLVGTREIEAIRLLKEVEKLDSLYQPDRDEEVNALSDKSKHITTSSQLIASLKGFNLDNAIVREQIIDMIRREVHSESQAKEHQMISMTDDENTTHYHYKRWLWVQFPWCTIDVHSDISNIMELFSGGSSQGADSNLYISATKENELAKATLSILHAAKQRSKKSYATANGSMNNTATKSLNQSQASSSAMNASLKKKNRKSGLNKVPKIGILPPVVPQSAKNAVDTTTINHSKSMGHGNRSISASRGEGGTSTPTGRLPLLRLDSEDRKSPEKTLAKISFTMANIETSKIKEIEIENVQLGAQLNNLNFLIYRKEKELKQLEEHFTAVMIEHSVNQEGQHKLEVMEAKLLKAYEDLNRVEVERKRIEQIVKACEKNPPNNEEQIRNLEQQIDVFVKLIQHHQSLMSGAHKEQELFKKQQSELQSEMSKLEHDRQVQILKMTDIVERKRRLELLMIEGDEGRKNFAMNPIESAEMAYNNAIDVGKLKTRQQNYKKWKAKLNVTKAFVSEKRLLFESSFRKMIEIAGLRKVETSTLLQKENPLQNLEGLIAFIERANDLDKSKRQKEAKIEKLKRDKDELMAELRKWENGVQLIECGHIERAQKKLYLEDKTLRSVKEHQQRQLSLIADLKSGFVNVAKILGIEEGLETESDQTALIEKICERFTKLDPYRNGSKNDVANGSDTLSADKENTNRSSKPNEGGDGGNNLVSPQGNRGRKKQPKQAKGGSDQVVQGAGKASLMAPGGPTNSGNVVGAVPGSNNGNSTIPMKLNEQRDSRDIDSDTEERQQLAQDRIKLKKNMTSNIVLTKAIQPTQTASQAGSAANPSTAGAGTEAKEEPAAAKGQSRNHFNVSGLKDKFKKTNLTASNPIIGAPLGDKSLSMKQFSKLQAHQQSTTIQFKSKDREGSASKQLSHSQFPNNSKPALANSKVPKYVKKTIKFAKEGTDGDAEI